MLARPAIGVAVLVFLFAVPSTKSEDRNSQSPADRTVILSTTHLVQINVLVKDKKGNPIPGLKKEDFTIFDQGKEQKVAFLTGGKPRPASVPTLPRNVFTNRFDLKGQEPGAVVVVLFDVLNTSFLDQSYAREQILSFLRTLKPQDEVALYALTTQLIILHEFTQDASVLVKALNNFHPDELAEYDRSNPKSMNLLDRSDTPAEWKRLEQAIQNGNEFISSEALIGRNMGSTLAFRAIADHVSGIPGRKSLVWISGGFPLQLDANIGRPYGETLGADPVNHAAQALNRVNMVVYPIDTKGVEVEPTDGSGIGRAFSDRQGTRDTFRLLADRTGGKAFYGSNDIHDSVQRAFDDGREGYVVGYYPDHGTWDGRFREIKIKVNADAAEVRYRKGYFASADWPDDESASKTALRDAATSPVEATTLGMIVSTKTVGSAFDRNIELHIGLDPKQLLLQDTKDHRKGTVDLFFVQRDESGKILVADKQRVDVDLDRKQYEHMAKTAVVFGKHLAVNPRAVDFRVVVRDRTSGELGSVTVPVKSLFSNETDAVIPARKKQ